MGAWFRKKIADLLVVDFQERNHDFHIPIVFSIFDTLEKVGHGQVDDAWV
jgi:hypothetical protein